jgi:hypothetical protein
MSDSTTTGTESYPKIVLTVNGKTVYSSSSSLPTASSTPENDETYENEDNYILLAAPTIGHKYYYRASTSQDEISGETKYIFKLATLESKTTTPDGVGSNRTDYTIIPDGSTDTETVLALYLPKSRGGGGKSRRKSKRKRNTRRKF